MIAWLAGNWPNLAAGAAVLALVAVSVRNLLPGRSSGCAGCAGCSGGSCPSCGK